MRLRRGLFWQDLKAADVVLAENPFGALGRSQYRALVVFLNVNSLFLNRVRDGEITWETIPVEFLNRLASGAECGG